jgi:hypothetical protein
MRCKFNTRFLPLLVLGSTLFLSELFAQEKVEIALWGDSRGNKDNACSNIAHILLYKIPDWNFHVYCGDFTHDGTDAEATEPSLSRSR